MGTSSGAQVALRVGFNDRTAVRIHDGHNNIVLPIGLKQFAIIRHESVKWPDVLSANVEFYDVQTSSFPVFGPDCERQ